MNTWVEGKVVSNQHWTDQLYSLKISADIEPFIAGQFCRLALDMDGERVARPYSLINSPDDNILEFYSIIVPEGPLSNSLSQLQPNDTVWVTHKASGFFTLNEVPDSKHLWLLSTGTGIGPFLSILKTQEPWSRFNKIILAHGVRHQHDLTYQELIQNLKNIYPEQFCYVPFVSRETVQEAIKEHIPIAIKEKSLEKKVNLKITPDDSQVMLCGNPSMISDTIEVLSQRGLKKNLRRSPGHITTEKYW